MSPAREADVLIAGGGLQGCATALVLARRGRSVIVFEKDFAGRHASGVNAGGVRRLNRHEAEIPLSLAALRLWQRLPELVGDDGGFVPSGQVRVAENDAEMDALAARAERMQTLGFTHEELLDRAQLRQVLPAAAPHCAGALICREDGFAEPFRAARAFKRAAEEAGATVLERTPLERVEVVPGGFRVTAAGRDYRGAVFVNCAGAWGDRIAAMLGDDPIPLFPTALSMMVTGRVPPFVEPVVGLAGRALSFKQMPNGTVVIGGGHESFLDMRTETTRIDIAAMRISAETAASVFAAVRRAPLMRCWAGIEGVTPDSLPLIGPSCRSGAFHAFGFSGHGFQLSPIIGHIMADLILTGKSDFDLRPFEIGRFSGAGGPALQAPRVRV